MIKNVRNIPKSIRFLFIMAMCVFLVSCSKKQDQIRTLSDLNGKIISVEKGSVFSSQIKECGKLNDAELMYTVDNPDALALLLSGKCDGYVADNLIVQEMIRSVPGITILDEMIAESKYGIAMRKGFPYTEAVNRILGEMRADGTMDALTEKWFGEDEEAKKIPEELFAFHPDAENTLICLENGGLKNICYRDSSGNLQGFDVEMILRIAEELNSNIRFEEKQFDEIIPSLNSGEGDFGISGISITEERKRYVNFSEPYLDASTVAVVRNESTGFAGSGLLFSVKNSFRKTFMEENRWKDILGGIGMTLILASVSMILGAVLGLGMYLVYYSENRFGRGVLNFLDQSVTLLPITVRFMFWFYLIYAGLSGKVNFLAALTVLTVDFGISIYSCIRRAIGGVGEDQSIAARAMGFSRYAAFWKILLPQAIPNILTSLQPEAINQVKDTSLVGFISVMDFQSVLDGIATKTGGFLMPILVSALFYLLLEKLACLLLRFIRNEYLRRVGEKKKVYENILKGEESC